MFLFSANVVSYLVLDFLSNICFALIVLVTGAVVQSTGSVSTSGSTSTSGSSTALSNGTSLQLVGHAQRGSTAVQQSLRQELLRNSSSNDLLHTEVSAQRAVCVAIKDYF